MPYRFIPVIYKCGHKGIQQVMVQIAYIQTMVIDRAKEAVCVKCVDAKAHEEFMARLGQYKAAYGPRRVRV